VNAAKGIAALFRAVAAPRLQNRYMDGDTSAEPAVEDADQTER